MTFIQVFIYFNYLLLHYLNSTFGQVYLTGVVSALAEIGSFVFSGIAFEKLGVKKTYILSLSIALVGGILVTFYGLDN